jgi:hypothetical protein
VLSHCPGGCVICTEPMAPLVRIQRSRNQKVKGLITLTIKSSNPLAEALLCFPTNLGSDAWRGPRSQKRGVLPLRDIEGSCLI